ncbi:MAG: SEC-C domain-containing protein, partial [Chloroflexi bacterium]|nr:SEC-C domain-containing protein [Chloroflexota bacterium]
YKLEVLEIPTNMPMIREDDRDLIYKDEASKFRAVVKDIKERSAKGQPILVGTTDIDKSELLSDLLKREGVTHEVLNAKQHEREANIIDQAGRPGAVTVATNMAGRGTDIVLGGKPDSLDISREQWEADHRKVIEQGGLQIIGTERHEARRIDNQLRGRSGRQGDPGQTRFYVALDDDLMRRFGGDTIKRFMDWALEDDTALESKAISKAIEGAQVKTESHHFDMRKHLVEYDDVVNAHRDIIYGEREKILGGADLKSNIQEMVETALTEICDSYMGDVRPGDWDTESLLSEISGIMPLPADLSDPDEVLDMSQEEIVDSFLGAARELYDEVEAEITAETMRRLERQVMLRVIDSLWVQHLTSMENLRQGIGLEAFGQRDPLVMYKKQGHEKFQELQAGIQFEIVHAIFNMGGMVQSSMAAGKGQRAVQKVSAKNTSVMANVIETKREKVPAGTQKVGRNAACPCGSGKKYKRCHGA